jgi:hypothetical protein
MLKAFASHITYDIANLDHGSRPPKNKCINNHKDMFIRNTLVKALIKEEA